MYLIKERFSHLHLVLLGGKFLSLFDSCGRLQVVASLEVENRVVRVDEVLANVLPHIPLLFMIELIDHLFDFGLIRHRKRVFLRLLLSSNSIRREPSLIDNVSEIRADRVAIHERR